MDKILESDELSLGALLFLYYEQEEEEMMLKSTTYKNRRGFSAADAGILSSISQFYLNRGFITPKQMTVVKSKLPKYNRQLEAVEIQPLPIKKVEQKKIEKEVQLINHQLIVKFEYHTELIRKIKYNLQSAIWNPKEKYWSCPNMPTNVEALKELGFPLPEELTKEKPMVDVDEIEGMKLELMPFQKEGVQKIDFWDGRAVLVDEMGLGKTIQALAWLQLHPEVRPAVIVPPAFLKINWEREAKKWMDNPNVQVLSSRPDRRTKPHGDIIIVNYDVLSDSKKIGWASHLKDKLDIKAVIIDEAHYCKNPKSKRTIAVQALTKGVPHVLALSGTPITSKPVEFFPILNMIHPGLFPNFFRYAYKFCDATRGRFGWDFSGTSNTEELHKLLTDNLMIRRKKEDVLKDLPPKRRVIVPLEIDNEKEYREVREDFIGWVRQKKGDEAAMRSSRAEQLAQIEALKQVAVKSKMKGVLEWVRSFLDSGEKLGIFAVHKKVLNELMKEFGDVAVKIDGSTSQIDRQKAVDAFQTNENVRLFVGNIQAAGVGLTLTAASNVAFIEYDWLPANMVQAEDRFHRIGQYEAVTCWYLTAVNTIDERLVNIIEYKARVLDRVLDGQEEGSTSVFNDLLEWILNN